jgi:hypothetical protein
MAFYQNVISSFLFSSHPVFTFCSKLLKVRHQLFDTNFQFQRKIQKSNEVMFYCVLVSF